MHSSFALAALASVAYALPQGGPTNKAPESPTPAGCQTSYDGQFQITIVNGSSTAMAKRQTSTCDQDNLATLKLADGVLTDAQGRIGSIVANYQFQFDGPPPQAGAIYTAGFSVCQNQSLALGGSAVFYSCASGGFSNLYDRAWAPQCLPVFINALPCGGAGGAGEGSDGQLSFTGAAPPVTQLSDGQPQATTAVNPPVTQITDGQVQVPTTAPTAPVTQISDGQVQVPTSAPIAPVTQISDGQVQVPTSAPAGSPVTQISDGQVQVPTTAAPAGTPITQIGDGQIQAPTSVGTAAGPAVTQIGDGQLQTNTSIPLVTVNPNAGNGLAIGSSLATVIVGAVAVLLL